MFPFLEKKIAFEDCEHEEPMMVFPDKNIMFCPNCGYHFKIIKLKHFLEK